VPDHDACDGKGPISGHGAGRPAPGRCCRWLFCLGAHGLAVQRFRGPKVASRSLAYDLWRINEMKQIGECAGPVARRVTSACNGLAILPRHHRSCDEGFLALDALIGLSILSISLALTLNALGVSRRLADAGMELRRAKQFAVQLCQANGPATATSGVSSGFRWTLEVSADPLSGPSPRLCRRHARLVSLKTARIFEASATQICPARVGGAA